MCLLAANISLGHGRRWIPSGKGKRSKPIRSGEKI